MTHGDSQTASLNNIYMPMDSAPIGTIQSYGAAAAPSGWLLCDGAAISRTTYAQLFAVIGTTFGTGDGSTTFNTPDMRGVFAKGAGTTNRTLGKDANGNFYAGTLGTYLTDKMQGHYHSPLTTNYFITAGGAGDFLGISGGSADGIRSSTGSPLTDGTNGTPRTGLTTEPQSLGLTYIIKALTTYQTVQVNIPSASILSGSGAPATAPVFVGQRYEDLTGGYIYEALGTSSTSDWKCIYFPPSYIRRLAGNTRGSTNTNVIIYGTADLSVGADITYVNSASAGDSFTINTTGIYSVNCIVFTTGSTVYDSEIRIGSTVDNVNGDAKTRATWTGGYSHGIAWTGPITAGDKVFVYKSSAPTSNTYLNQITIARVG